VVREKGGRRLRKNFSLSQVSLSHLVRPTARRGRPLAQGRHGDLPANDDGDRNGQIQGGERGRRLKGEGEERKRERLRGWKKAGANNDTQPVQLTRAAIRMSAVDTMILSATGSRNAPKADVILS
jgi:hypothetical protein